MGGEAIAEGENRPKKRRDRRNGDKRENERRKM